jgi:hypothetical protein
VRHARHREHEPVEFDPATSQWFVFAYDDVLAGLSDPRLTNDRIGARTAARGGRELNDEAVGNLALPYLTGQVAVAQLIANSVWLLLVHEDQRARLAADPALLPGAFGETLRYLPPASLATRIALEPLTLRGHRVEPGQTVQLSLAAANRDPERFPDPDRFDIARRQAGAVGLGHGVHMLHRRRAGADADRHRAARAPGSRAGARPRRRERGRLEPAGRHRRSAGAGRPRYSSARSSSGSVTGVRHAKRSHT